MYLLSVLKIQWYWWWLRITFWKEEKAIWFTTRIKKIQSYAKNMRKQLIWPLRTPWVPFDTFTLCVTLAPTQQNSLNEYCFMAQDFAQDCLWSGMFLCCLTLHFILGKFLVFRNHCKHQCLMELVMIMSSMCWILMLWWSIYMIISFKLNITTRY